MILRKTLMATTALMISLQPAMSATIAPNGSQVAYDIAQGAEAAQILNDAITELNQATAALAQAEASGEGVEAAQQAVAAAQARVNQAQADFDAAQAAQEPAPEPEAEAPAPEAPAAEEPAPEPEAPAAEEAAPEAVEEPAPEAPATEEAAPEATPEAEAPAVEPEAPETEAEVETEVQEEAPAAEETAPQEPAAEEAEPAPEAAEEPVAEEAPADSGETNEAETEAAPETPETEEQPAAEQPAAEADAANEVEADVNVEVTEPAAEAEPVEDIIEETKQTPATVLPEDVSEQEKAALEKAEKQRREDSRKRRNELIGAAAVGVAVGALVPLLGGKLVEDQGDRVIIERNGEYFVRKDENALLRRDGVQVDYEELRNGLSRETMTRPNGVQIVTTRAPNGDILRRERIRRDGTVVVLIDSLDRGNVEYVDYDRELPPINLTIDRGLYVVEAQDANQERLRETFFAPPVDEVRQRYTLREVRSSERLRDIVRRVDLDNIQFDTGSATVRQSQVPLLEKAALAMADVINDDPTAVFLIEGHTDAVGGEVYNLALSDRRAETVARILTTNYGLPPENFVVEGYGEADLKIDSQGDEPRNRRVAIRNITPLLNASN